MASEAQSKRVKGMEEGFQAAFALVTNFYLTKDMLKAEALILWLKKAGIVCPETGVSEENVNRAIREVKKGCKDPDNLDITEVHHVIGNIARENKMNEKDLLRSLMDCLGPEWSKGLDKGVEVAKGVLRTCGIVSKDMGISNDDLENAVQKYCKDKGEDNINVNELEDVIQIVAKEKGVDEKILCAKLHGMLTPALNKDGITCPPDEHLSRCRAHCEKTCDNYEKPFVCPSICIRGCTCNPGLVRDNDGHCVPIYQCPQVEGLNSSTNI